MSDALSEALANYSSEVACLNTTCNPKPRLHPALHATAGTVTVAVSAAVAGTVAGAVAGCRYEGERRWEWDRVIVHISLHKTARVRMCAYMHVRVHACARVDNCTMTGSVAGAVAGSAAVPTPGASVYQLIGATQFMVQHTVLYVRPPVTKCAHAADACTPVHVHLVH